MMTGRLRTSRAGLELIKSFEGFREAAVRLPDGRWTIGYGHVRTAREGLTINDQDAEDLLSYDLRTVEDAILSMLFAPLNQNQFDALVSLVFNISPGRFRDSDILRLLNGGDFLSAAAAFDAWRKARIHGRVMVVDALVRRRAAEKAMFLEHPGGRPSAPTPLVRPELDLAPGEASGRADSEPDETAPSGTVEDAPSPRAASSDIAEAVRRLAERTQDAITPAPEPYVSPPRPEPAPRMDPKAGATPAPQPAKTLDDIEQARREVAERVARILARAEGAIAEQQAAEARASARREPSPPSPPPVTPRVIAAAIRSAPPKTEREIPEDLPDFDAPPSRGPAASAGNGRTFIDDTEMFDPGRDPAEMFAEAEREAKVVQDRSQRMGPLNGRMVVLAPWIAILTLSILGLAIGVVEGVKAGVEGWVPTVLALSGMLTAMSIYFMVTRAKESAA